ncbi:hypothetical protein HB834_17215, partial [Listeria booriae]|uniref:hypothetical protein n=1 Tax=Listeria booriae TaxID=1552123 RepID=UPI00164E4ED6
YMEFDHNEYIGPIDGPLWCGLTSVVLSLYVSENIADVENLDKYEYEDQQLYGGNDDYAEIGLMGNISLALYILPDNYLKNGLKILLKGLFNYILCQKKMNTVIYLDIIAKKTG